MRYRAIIYATDVKYTGNFADNDKSDLLILGREQGDEDIVETDIIDEHEVIEYENREEVRDLGNGVCTVYWCEVEADVPTEEERAYEAECEYCNYMEERQREMD